MMMICLRSLLQAVFLFSFLNHFFLFFNVDLLYRFGRLMIEHDQVAVANVETGQMVAGVLGVKNVLVDNEGSSSRLRRGSTKRIGFKLILIKNKELK
jgi:hypothetical protein